MGDNSVESMSKTPTTTFASSPPRRRYTREDIHLIPSGFIKREIDIDSLFDDDGFLRPVVASMIDFVRICLVCSAPTKNRCSACKNVSYCSKECQKSHWKAHAPICDFSRSGDLDMLRKQILEAGPGTELAQYTHLTPIISQNRPFTSVVALLEEWLQDAPGFVPRGGSLSCLIGSKKRHKTELFTFVRNDAQSPGWWLKIVDVGRQKARREKLLRQRIVTDPDAYPDVVSCIAACLEVLAKDQANVPMMFSCISWSMPPIEMTQKDYEEGRMDLTERSAVLQFDEAGRFKVAQLNPELLGLMEKVSCSVDRKLVRTTYRW